MHALCGTNLFRLVAHRENDIRSTLGAKDEFADKRKLISAFHRCLEARGRRYPATPVTRSRFKGWAALPGSDRGEARFRVQPGAHRARVHR